MTTENSSWLYIRNIIIPAFLIVTSPILNIYLAIFAHVDDNSTWIEILIGNQESWMIVFAFGVWAWVFLKIPSKQHYGPTTQFGYTPRYQHNGFFYYVSSCLTFLLLCYIYPTLPGLIYKNIVPVLATSNVLGFIFCFYLWWQGTYYPQTNEKRVKKSFISEFFLGIEIYPRVFDVDVKQYTNCRFGMMQWQLLIVTYWIVGYERYGFNWGHTVSLALQTLHIFKFFWWEIGYTDGSIDNTLDRAGFYMCWGCLNFIAGLYCFPSYYFVANPPIVSKSTAQLILVAGAVCNLSVYLIDRDKEIFKLTNGKRSLLSNNPSYLDVEYKTADGIRQSKLLTSGFWGICRHLNYTFEITFYYLWGLPGYGLGIWPLIVGIFLHVLAFHRIYRDDNKCRKKYGEGWVKYCKTVKYKMIPFVF